ncbi:MAG: hypothetical protein RIT04_301 [Candidatus Parcubacteria bacterium]|jgi:predicted dehydrogenase
MKKIRIALIGCAGHFGRIWLRNLFTLQGYLGCELVVCCDGNVAAFDELRGMYPSVKFMSSEQYDLVLGMCDAVVIATPPATHFKLAMKALQAHKDVLVEKPLAYSPSECELLTEFAEKQGCIVMSGLTYLYSAAFHAIKNIIDTNQIGKVIHIDSRRESFGRYSGDNHVTQDLGPHDLSMILAVMGEMPLAVSCTGHQDQLTGHYVRTNTHLTFSGGRSASIISSWISANIKVRKTEFFGEIGVTTFDDSRANNNGKVVLHSGLRVTKASPNTAPGGHPFVYHAGAAEKMIEVAGGENITNEARHFVDCIKHREVPISAGEAGVDVAHILFAAEQSLEMHKTIGLPPGIAGRHIDTRHRKLGQRTSAPVPTSPAAVPAVGHIAVTSSGEHDVLNVPVKVLR